MLGQSRRIEVSRVIDAAAHAVFALLVRPDNHVVLDTSGMMRRSAGHGAVTGVGHIETPASQHISKLSSGNRRFTTTWP
jgi:hypothetical protein